MPFYENVYITRQDFSTSQIENMVEKFQELIKKYDGKVTKVEQWGLRTLAYPINKSRKGHYVLMNIDAPAAAIEELERIMRINEDVLRFLTVRVEELEEGPSVVMRRSSEPSRRPYDNQYGYEATEEKAPEKAVSQKEELDENTKSPQEEPLPENGATENTEEGEV